MQAPVGPTLAKEVADDRRAWAALIHAGRLTGYEDLVEGVVPGRTALYEALPYLGMATNRVRFALGAGGQQPLPKAHDP